MSLAHALVVHAAAGDVTEVERLLAAGAAVDARDPSGDTALCAAAARGHARVVAVLLAAGADVDARGTYVARHVREAGCTPLVLAAMGGHEDAARALLAAGADLGLASEAGTTPLLAAVSSAEALVPALLAAGAPVEAADAGRATALHVAAMYGRAALVRALVGRGAAVDARDDAGNTPLLLAADDGDVETLAALLDAGADPHAENEAGRTAIEAADEHGHAEAVALLRARGPAARARRPAPVEVAPFVASLARVKANVTRPWEQVEATADDPARLVALAAALRDGPPGVAAWVVESVYDRVERVLAMTPGLAQARAALAVLRQPRPAPRDDDGERRPREAAALLASGQTVETFLALLAARGADDGFLALWAQELVARGARLDAHPDVAGLWSRLRAAGDPLAALPLARTALEGALDAVVPRYSRSGGMGCGSPFGPYSGEDAPRPAAAATRAVRFREVTDERFAVAARAVVRGWEARSNGRAEARAFVADRPLDDGALGPETLRALGLACLEGADPSSVHAAPATAERAFTLLFAAATNGGAYGGACGSAWGRLLAFRALGALAGRDASSDVADVVRAAGEHRWTTFAAASPWFWRVCWDLGLAALSPARDALRVLAATDTD